MIKIYLEPEEIWDFFTDNYGNYTFKLIAENQEYGVEIYLDFYDDCEYPAIRVDIDDDEPVNEYVKDEAECIELVKDVYDVYLDPDVSELLDGLREVEEDFESIIEEREEELDNLVTDFVIDVTNEYCDDEGFSDIINDLKEHFLAYMYKKHNLNPFRPMIIKDESGEKVFKEYPYESIM